MYAVEEAASRTLLIKNFKNLQEKMLKFNSRLFHGILLYLYLYVTYMTMAESNDRNMFVGKYIRERTVVMCCVCVDFKSPPD
jgi:hypothetical protein